MCSADQIQLLLPQKLQLRVLSRHEKKSSLEKLLWLTHSCQIWKKQQHRSHSSWSLHYRDQPTIDPQEDLFKKESRHTVDRGTHPCPVCQWDAEFAEFDRSSGNQARDLRGRTMLYSGPCEKKPELTPMATKDFLIHNSHYWQAIEALK